MLSTQEKCWLMKSEPGTFSIDDLKRDKRTMWDGVRNYQVRNMMRDDMKVGDRALFYHSNCKDIGVVGEMKIVKKAYPDPTQFDPKNDHFDPKSKHDNPAWLAVDVRFVKKFPRLVTLAELKNDPAFSGLGVIQKGSRLSVQPVSKKHFERILKLGGI